MDLYADGSGLQGACAIYVKIVDSTIPKKKRHYLQVFNEDISSDKLEYKALIKALTLAKPGSKIFSDNMGIVDEVILAKPPASGTKDLFKEAKKIIDSKPGLMIHWVPREKNLAGIYLERRLNKLSKFNDVRKIIHKRKRQEWKNRRYGRKKIKV